MRSFYNSYYVNRLLHVACLSCFSLTSATPPQSNMGLELPSVVSIIKNEPMFLAKIKRLCGNLLKKDKNGTVREIINCTLDIQHEIGGQAMADTSEKKYEREKEERKKNQPAGPSISF